MTSSEFRKELMKIMPGYNWVVHNTSSTDFLAATGIQSSGFNRLSTLAVKRTAPATGGVTYQVKSAGSGTKSPWVYVNEDGTLARALRGLQDHYENNARTYQRLVSDLRAGRGNTPVRAVPQPPQEPTPEAVERAAIALYVARCSALGRTEENWRRMADEHRVGYLFDARTALTAALTAPACP